VSDWGAESSGDPLPEVTTGKRRTDPDAEAIDGDDDPVTERAAESRVAENATEDGGSGGPDEGHASGGPDGGHASGGPDEGHASGGPDGGHGTDGSDPSGTDAWLYGWALGYAAVGAASLSVPLYAIDLGAGAFVVSLIAATAAFAGVPGAILWGRLVARTRQRRPFVLVALGLTTGVLLSLPFLTSPWTVLLANAVLWFVVAAAAPVLNIIVVEGHATDQWNRRFGLLNHYQGYGWLAGLVAGGAWSVAAGPRFGLASLPAMRLFFVFSGVAGALGVLVVLAWYPEAPTMSEQRFRRLSRRIRLSGVGPIRSARGIPFGPVRIYWALGDLGGRGAGWHGLVEGFRDRFPASLRRYLLAATVFFAGFSAFFGPLPAYFVSAGYGTGEVFALFIINSAASAVAYGRAGVLASERDAVGLQLGALAFRAGSFPIVAIVGAAVAPPFGLVAVAGLFVGIGVSWAVVAVTATGLVTRFATETGRAEALGLYTAIGSLGGGIGSALGGAVAEGFGYSAAFVVASGLVAVAVLIVRGNAADRSSAIR
jgi:MFS family permease